MKRWTFSLCALFLAGAAVHAGTPRLQRLSPPGGQRGTTVEVSFQGRYLEQPREVLFYEPGITAEPVEKADGDGTSVRVKLKLAADCPLGPHGVRLRTATGVTEYHRFL